MTCSPLDPAELDSATPGENSRRYLHRTLSDWRNSRRGGGGLRLLGGRPRSGDRDEPSRNCPARPAGRTSDGAGDWPPVRALCRRLRALDSDVGLPLVYPDPVVVVFDNLYRVAYSSLTSRLHPHQSTPSSMPFSCVALRPVFAPFSPADIVTRSSSPSLAPNEECSSPSAAVTSLSNSAPSPPPMHPARGLSHPVL